MMTCHVRALYILHCCKYSVKQFKGTFASIECVLDSHAKYPAGICLLHLGKCTKFVGTIVLSPSNYSLEMPSATIKTVVSAY